MKVRTGFISNSSSTSFVVLLPESFETERVLDDLTTHIDALVVNGEVYREEVGGDIYDKLQRETEKYVIAEIESGPDDDRIILADRVAARRALNEG